MIWAFFGVVALVAGVLCYLGARTWQPWHLVVLFFVMMAMSGLLVLAAMTLNTHKYWREEYRRLEQQVTTAQEAVDRLRLGNSLLPADEAMASLPAVTGELGRTVVDRGRVWRNVSPTDVQGNRITLSMVGWGDRRCARVGLAPEEGIEPEPDPAAEGEEGAAAGPGALPHHIDPLMVVYVFQETPITEFDETLKAVLFGDSDLAERDTEGVCKLPTSFLGDFRVVESNDATIVIESLAPLDEFQLQAVQNIQGTTWALYELMPLDKHEIFVGFDANALGLVIPEDMTGLSPDGYQDLIQSYLRDQQPAGAGDPPDRTWTKVRFVQDHAIDVDLDNADTGAETSFDPSGRAQLPHLRHGGPIEFKRGDEIYLDTETANRLVREGRCELTDEPPMYMRLLRDYVLYFHQTQFELDRLEEQIATIETDSIGVVAAAQKAQAQITYRTAEKEKLTNDLGNFKRELTAVNELRSSLQTQQDQQRQEIRRLFHANRDMERQLTVQLGGPSSERAVSLPR